MIQFSTSTGWFWHERDKRGFRWTERRATCYLESRDQVRYISLSGFSPSKNRLHVDVNGIRVGEHPVAPESAFEVKFLLPFAETADQIFEVAIESTRTVNSQESSDKRDLSLMIFSVGVHQ